LLFYIDCFKNYIKLYERFAKKITKRNFSYILHIIMVTHVRALTGSIFHAAQTIDRGN